jgi:hypothetical protein
MPAEMTCWSCEYYHRSHCELDRPLWPHGGPGWCESFAYEPGASPSDLGDDYGRTD